MPTTLPLSKLVDLALGTPEVGAVNFNVLHTLLHAMITKLNLNDIKAEINDSDRDFLSSTKPQRILTALSDIDSGKGEDSEDALSEFRDASETDSSPVSSATHKSKRSVPYHHLELRVEKLAEQLDSLNALPSTADLFERAKAKGDGERPLAEMWQYMQLKKKVDANEDGVGKLMSMMEDLMKEMQVLRDANADLMNKVNSLDIDDLKKKLAELEKITTDLNDKFGTLPSPEEWAQFVTWPLLEDALKGVRKDMEGMQSVTPTERVVVEIASQTDPKIPSRPPSSRPLSRLSTSSSGPTDNLLDVLERLGKLSEDHEALAKRVQELEDQLKNKVDKDALENLSVDLGSAHSLAEMQQQLANTRRFQELAALQEKLNDSHPVLVTIAQTPSQEHTQTQTPPRSPQPSSPIPKSPSTSPPRPPKSPSPEPPTLTPEIIRTPSPVIKSPTPPPKSPTPPPKSPTPPPDSPTPPPKSPTPPPKSPSPPPASPDPVVREPSPSPESPPLIAATPPIVLCQPEPVELPDIGQVVDHLLTTDLSADLLDQLNKLKEEMDALQAMRDKHPELSTSDNLQRYLSKCSSVKTRSSNPPTSDGETSDSGTISGSEGVSVEQSKSNQELLSILRSRVSDSEAFEELIGRLGNLEDKFKGLQNAILNPMGHEDSGFSSEPVSDLRSFLSDMEEKIELLSTTSSNTATTENVSEADVGRQRRKSKAKRRASMGTTEEKPESGFSSQFGGIFESDSADDESGQDVNAVSVELVHTNEKLKKLGIALDQQMGQLKDKVFKLDTDLKRMAKGVEFALLRSRVSGLSDMDSDALSRAQQAILQLQAELEKLQATTNNIISENQHRSKQIESLLTYCDTLQEKKADKEYVSMEVDVKADKRQLENKVNHSLFDSTTGEINRLIKEILDKLDGHENGWKDAYKQLADDVEGKLDRLEIDPLKEWLENRLKALNKKIMANANQDWGEDDAAGLRKQLLQRFNCLSCDRPVDLMPTGPVPSLPSQNGLPATRSPRPYTTFELEQIRQHAKSGMLGKNMVNFERALAEKELAKMRRADLKAFLVHFGQDIEAMSRRQQEADFTNQDVSDYYATMRQCGGSHTLTYPHKRVSRMTQMNNLFKDEVEEPQQPPPTTVYPIYKEEVDVQGVDGHIYRGRMERVQIEAKMPSKMSGAQQKQTAGSGQRMMQKIPQTESMPARSTPTPPSNMRGRPMSARGTPSPRPGSGRPMSRSQSRPMSARQSGQESSRTTPFPDDSYNQTDGADQGQTTVVEAEAIRVDVPTPDITEEPTEEE